MHSPSRRSPRVHILRLFAGLLIGAIGVWRTPRADALNVERLEPDEVALLESVRQHLDPLISARKQDGTANLLTWDDLLKPLSEKERAFVAAFRNLRGEQLGATTPPPVWSRQEAGRLTDVSQAVGQQIGGGASHYFGEPDATAQLVAVGPQSVLKDGVKTLLDPQVLPKETLDAYETMMSVMERDLGRRLLVESGYRSPAYQLYLFWFYLPKHGSSIRETNRYVALPGHSEHGYPPRQAIDFINQDGINGEDHPEEFEALPEYHWLQQHAREFGFALSYPRDNPSHTAFEPWHWHYENRPQSTVHSPQ